MNNENVIQINGLVAEYCNQNIGYTFDPKNPVVRLHEPTFGGEEINAALNQMLSTHVTMGQQVRKFEQQYADYSGTDYAVMSNSGSSANLLAVAALANHATDNNLKPGDEVIVPALSWSTTVWPLIQYNLKPVFVDCDPATFNFDLEQLESAIGPKTKAVMLVHVYGNPCDMDRLMDICQRHNLQLIEDTCESMGASYKGKKVGSFGRAGTFSTYFSHHITTLEGGLTVTDDFELAETMRVLRAHGWSREADQHQKYIDQYPHIDPRFIFINLGYNLRPTEVQGAMGQKQLPKLDDIVNKRRANVSAYRKAFEKYAEFFDFQDETPGAYCSWFGFSFILKDNVPFGLKDITGFLKSCNIENRPIIAGNIARHPVMEHYEHRIVGDLKNCDRIMQRGFAIGCHQDLCEASRGYVIQCLDDFMQKAIKKAA
jgi:CDP-6-deoxy-D-xylo-4-hexulose-3-dehydrase